MPAASISPDVVALMLADARLPTGGHAQSAGLEPAVQSGLTVADVVEFARGRLHTVTRVDAGTAVVARHLTLTGADPLMVQQDWAARTPSHVLRNVSRRQGRGFLRLAARVWPSVREYLPADGEIPRPIVIGVIAGVTGVSARQLARLVCYDDVQTVTAAALKLLPVDPVQAVAWTAELHADIESVVDAVAEITDCRRIPANGAPMLDVLAEQHSNERMRLFHA